MRAVLVFLTVIFVYYTNISFLGVGHAKSVVEMIPLENEKKSTSEEIWTLLLQSKQKDLLNIEKEVKGFLQNFSSRARALSVKVNEVQQAYEQYSTIGQVSSGMPVEFSLIDERLRKLNASLLKSIMPFKENLQQLQERLREVTLIGQSVSGTYSDVGLKHFRAQLAKVEADLSRLEQKTNETIKPAIILQGCIVAKQKEFSVIIPELWKKYYLVPTGKLYTLAGWSKIDKNVTKLKRVFVLRVMNELPSGKTAWGVALLQMVSVFIPFALVRSLLKKFSMHAPNFIVQPLTRVNSVSVPMIFLGLALHFASISPAGENYYIFSIVGTLFMAIGEIDLAWALYRFTQQENALQDIKISPFFRLLVPVFSGIILLLLSFSGVLLGIAWIGVILVALYYEHKVKKRRDTSVFIESVLSGYVFVLWASLAVAVFGWIKIAIIGCALYVSMIVCIQEIIGVLRLSNIISENMSREGIRGLLSGMLLAIGLPLMIFIIVVLTALWVVAYPGGAYLVSHITQLDFSVGKVTFSLIQLCFLAGGFYITRSFVNVGHTFIASLPSQNTRIGGELVSPIQTAYKYIMWSIFVFYGLYLLGVSLTSLAVVAGGLSVGIGFGLQAIMNNFISGLLIIFGQTLREGDVIDLGNNLFGVVRKVNIRSTLIETYDNAVVFVPNSEFVTNRLTNWTRNSRSVRREIVVGVTYDSNVDLVIDLLKDLANNHPKVLRFPEAFVVVNEFGSSALVFILRFWVGDIAQAVDVTSSLRVAIVKEFSKHNIKIAFSQLDVHIDNVMNKRTEELGSSN